MTPDESVIVYRIQALERIVGELEKKVDRLSWALVSLSLSITVAVIVYAITAVGSR